jgi:glucosyl-3-phosphoglycerate synthase
MGRIRRAPTLRALARHKARQGCTVSVCIPAHGEERTIGVIVTAVRRVLMERVEVVDEVLVLDDHSTDATAEVAAASGARVVAEEAVLPHLPAGSGKGNAMWKALYVSNGDLVCFVDGDVRNFGAHFVTRLVEPLLTRPDVAMVKAYYRRPLDGARTGGGRVTELMARPLLSHVFPSLARFLQPLSGEYAARRSLLEAVPFMQGWGVEIGLLIDVTRAAGIDAVVQADLGVREHRNRPLDELGPQALAILVTALRRAGLESSRAPFAELVRVDSARQLEQVLVEVRERPPMLRIPEYCAKFGRELTA